MFASKSRLGLSAFNHNLPIAGTEFRSTWHIELTLEYALELVRFGALEECERWVLKAELLGVALEPPVRMYKPA